MRAMIALQSAADLGPGGRAALDELMAKTPAADSVGYEEAAVGGVPGWWCRPADANPDAAILYLNGGAYVVGSAQAYRHFAGQIAERAKEAAFVADYGLAPERPFLAAVDDAEAAYRGLASGGVSRIAIVGDSAGGGLALVTAERMAEAPHIVVGQKPETVDFSDPSLPQGFDADKINAGIAVAVKKIEERGWHGDTCMITPDDEGSAVLQKQLAGVAYDCVVIGGGLRIPPKGLVLFEAVVNIVHRAAPGTAIAFNTRPEDTADAAARGLEAI